MIGSKDKVNELKIQVDQVVDVMQENLKNVAERGETLESLQEKSGKKKPYCMKYLFILHL